MTTLTIKIQSFYAACSPEFGVVCYGACQDEAINNLHEETASRTPAVGKGSDA